VYIYAVYCSTSNNDSHVHDLDTHEERAVTLKSPSEYRAEIGRIQLDASKMHDVQWSSNEMHQDVLLDERHRIDIPRGMLLLVQSAT
jgi:hypothetical protein